MASNNDQIAAGGPVGSTNDVDAGAVLDRWESAGVGTQGDLFTHDHRGSSLDDAPTGAETSGAHRVGDSDADALLEGSTDDDSGTPPPASTRGSSRRWRKPALIGGAVLVVALAVAGGGYAAMNKTVTISVDGVSQQVSTLSGSVEGAVDAAGLTVGEHDTLAPAADASISDGSQIAIERGRLLTLTIDGQTRQVWTTATTVEEALAELGQNPAAFRLSADRSRAIGLDGLALTADTMHAVTVTNRGAVSQSSTAAKTVNDLLAELGISIGANDRVSPAVATPVTEGLAVTVVTLPSVGLTVGADPATTTATEGRTVGDVLSRRVSDSGSRRHR